MITLLRIAVLLAGVGMTMLAAAKPWAQAPSAERSASGEITLQEPAIQGFFQIGAGVAGLVFLVSLWKPFRRRCADTVVASLWLAAALSFPCLLIACEPAFVSRTAWLHCQFEHMIWLGGDINVGFESTATGRQRRMLVVDPPRQYLTSESPDWSAAEIGFARLPNLFEWSGYSNSFCQFVGKGWLLAVLGGAAAVVGTMSAGASRLRTRFLIAVTVTGVALGVTMTPVCCQAFAAGKQIAVARQSAAVGNPLEALDRLQRASETYPLFAMATPFVTQVALLEEQLATGSSAAFLGRAILLEQEGLRWQASEVYAALCERLDPNDPICRVARHGLLRQAVARLNRGQEVDAARLLQQVLASDPCELKALAMLQVAMTRTGDTVGAARVVSEVYTVCHPMRFPTKKILLADLQRRAFFAEAESGLTQAAWRRLPKTRSP